MRRTCQLLTKFKMKYNLDSALVIVLKDAIKWESSTVAYAGTLSPVNFGAPLDPLDYQRRDRQLAFRDLITASAIVEASVQVSDVWNCTAPKPQLQGPVIKDMPEIVRAEMQLDGSNASMLRHVLNVSIPADAARYADSDLYGRDCLIYETLVRATGSVFSDPPLTSIDSHGTIIDSNGSFAWSLGEGVAVQADINASLPLSLSTFKQPDQNLADRDNQMAGYVANVAKVLKNPFEYANRLYVQVDAPSMPYQRESEVYTLSGSYVGERVWTCEPALSYRNRIIYSIAQKTLQWIREDDTKVHQPQIIALSIDGIETDQKIVTVAAVPEGKDCQYWRSKAGQIKPAGIEIVDIGSIAYTSDATVAVGGIMQPDCISLTVPGVIDFTLPNVVPASSLVLPVDYYRVSILVQPDPTVEIMGNQNTTLTSGTLGGANYGVNFAAYPEQLPPLISYRVVEGDGVWYAGTTYYASATFNGTGTDATKSYYYPVGLVPSTLNQYAINFRMALPPGPWTVEMGYTNLDGVTDGFGVRSQFLIDTQSPVDILQDLTPLPFSTTNGTVLVTPTTSFEVPFITGKSEVPHFDYPIYWTYGNGSLSVRNLVFRSTSPETDLGTYNMVAQMAGVSGSAYFTAERLLPQVLRFDFKTAVSTDAFSVQWLYSPDLEVQNGYVPLKIKQLHIQNVGTYAATPLSDEFQGWRQECLERAEYSIQQNYLNTVVAHGTRVPVIRTDGSYWGRPESENWMAFVETSNPRLREVSDLPQTGYMVAGRCYEVTSAASVVYNGVTYTSGARFYGVDGVVDYSGAGIVKQVGAFIKSKPGHIGKPALMPDGLYFLSTGTVAAAYDTPHSLPRIVACQPWMIDCGLYVAQSDFWVPEHI